MLDNQTLQYKYPHLEVSVSPLSKVKKHFILGSNFNSNIREETLSNIKSEYKVSDYFDLINATISQIQEPYYIYDLTHSLGNFLQDVELTQNKLGSNKKQVKKDDLIISRLRSYLQEIAVVQQKKFKQLVSTEYLVYRPKTELISSNTLMVFALTKSVQTILSYSQYGTEHPRFYEFVFDEMPIPKVILELNHHIDSMIKEAYKAIESSKTLYKEAEALLYEALGLDSKNPLQSILNTHANRSSVIARNEMTKQSIYRNIDCHKFDKLNSCNDEAVSPNTTIATLKESFLKTGRLDAEYYQSKYEDIEAKIHNFPTIKLKDLVQYPITSGATPKAGGSDYTDSKNGIPFLRAVDLKNARVDIANLLYIKPETHAKSLKRTKLIKGDVLFSIAGVIGRCAIFDYDFEANINQALAILRFTESKGIKRLYLIAFFNSQFGQIYLERYSRQGLQTNLNLDEVGNLEIPIIDSTTQAQIAAHIQKSFKLRAEAKILLESAKAEVESALNNANNGGG